MPIKLSGTERAIAFALLAVAGAFRVRAVPSVRRMPRRVAFTPSAFVGRQFVGHIEWPLTDGQGSRGGDSDRLRRPGTGALATGLDPFPGVVWFVSFRT